MPKYLRLPLPFEEALSDVLQVKPEPKAKRTRAKAASKPARKPRKKR